MLHKHDLALESCELKFAGDTGKFEGYASVFGGVDSYGDTINKGAFLKTLDGRQRMPLMLYGHNPGRVIGKWLHLEEDSKGLIAHGEFTPGHSDAQDVFASMKHGALDALSIGFRIPKGGAEEKADGGRIIKDVDLVEISVVSMPADDSARIHSIKALIDTIETLKDAEYFLREAGISRSAARDFVSRISKLIRREGGSVKEEITKQEEAIIERIKRLEKLLKP